MADDENQKTGVGRKNLLLGALLALAALAMYVGIFFKMS